MIESEALDSHERHEGRLSIKDIMLIATAIIGVACFIGNWYIYPDRQKRGEEQIFSLEQHFESAAKERQDLQLRISEMEIWRQQADLTLIQARSHMADHSLHIGADEVKSLIALQMNPLTVLVETIKANMENQQRTLDRMETNLDELVKLKREGEDGKK